MIKPKFGPAGNSDSFYQEGFSASVDMPKWLAARNLDAFEYSFGRGIRLERRAQRPSVQKLKSTAFS